MRPRSPLHFLLAALVSLLGACRIPAVHVHNLREVHDPDGSPSRKGNLQNDVQFLFRGAADSLNIRGVGIFAGGEEEESEGESIDDPYGLCLESLVALAEADSDELDVLAMQVEMFCWLAARDTYALSRRRCVLELGPIARQLRVKSPLPEPIGDGVVGPTEVGDGLDELLAAARPVLAGDLSGRNHLDNVCARLGSLEMDLNGTLRLVRALGILLDVRGSGREEFESMRTLLTRVEKRSVAFALAYAVVDESPLVRSAAVEAGVELSNNGDPGLLLSALEDPSAEVIAHALRLLADRGLPRPSEEDEVTPEQLRGLFVERIVQLLRTQFEGPVSVNAGRALGRISGSGKQSLRPEEWIAWWADENRAEEASAPRL